MEFTPPPLYGSQILSYSGEDETSEGNPGNRNGDAVYVAPPIPGPEDEAAAVIAAVEPEPRVPVVQELYLTLDNPTDRALFQLGTWPSELRLAVLHAHSGTVGIEW